jgi:MYXO-CTERM domain-containing protein
LADGLAAFYPPPASVQQAVSRPPAIAASAALGLLALAALAAARRRPYVTVGALWYLGSLVPVIGLVQVGSQSRADRYTYVPLVGVFIAFAWLLGEWAAARPRARAAISAGAVGAVAAFAIAAHAQAAHWRDGDAQSPRDRGHLGNWLA